MGLFSKAPGDKGYKTLLENLCHLEINTIIKENMTGGKMPVPEIALLDLAELYAEKLSEVGGTAVVATTGGPMQYSAIHARANEVLDVLRRAGSPGEQTVDYWLVARIRNNASQILSIFQAVAARQQKAVDDVPRDRIHTAPIELLADEIVVLRKAWELGLEEIAIQTVIQLDGDVVHRVQPQYANGTHQPLLAIHESAIQTSVAYWKTLVDLIGDFLGGAARLLGLRA